MEKLAGARGQRTLKVMVRILYFTLTTNEKALKKGKRKKMM